MAPASTSDGTPGVVRVAKSRPTNGGVNTTPHRGVAAVRPRRASAARVSGEEAEGEVEVGDRQRGERLGEAGERAVEARGHERRRGHDGARGGGGLGPHPRAPPVGRRAGQEADGAVREVGERDEHLRRGERGGERAVRQGEGGGGDRTEHRGEPTQPAGDMFALRCSRRGNATRTA